MELGRGGMGVTYKAFDITLGRDVALKVISPQIIDGDEGRQRFLREARTAASFRHPHVASVYYLGDADGSCFYAMEFVDGETLDAYSQRAGKIPVATALEILDQVADALGAAGQSGLVHRDIKPSNIMIFTDFNGKLTAKLIDFGLAKSFQRIEGDSSATLTLAGFVGTPAYASPEQLENQELDTRTDIYSLGVTLYYMLCGKPPFSGSLASVISQHLTRPIPVSALITQQPEIVQLVVEMTAKSKESRPKDASALRIRIASCRTAADRGTATQWLTPYFSGQIPASASNRRGRSFAAIAPDGKPVEILVLDSDWTSDPAAFSEFEAATQELNKASIPGFRKVLSVAADNGEMAVICEKREGDPLLHTLKARKTLQPAEMLAVMRPIAKALDSARQLGLSCPDLTLHDIFLTPAASNDALADPTAQVDALVFLHHQGIGGDATLIPGIGRSPAQPPGATNLQSAYLGLAASLVCELLGSHRTSAAFTPLPTLTADGNSVLRKALAEDATIVSLTEFIQQLSDAEGNPAQENVSLGLRTLPGIRMQVPGPQPGDLRKHDAPAPHKLRLTAISASLVFMVLATCAGIFVAGTKQPVPARTKDTPTQEVTPGEKARTEPEVAVAPAAPAAPQIEPPSSDAQKKELASSQAEAAADNLSGSDPTEVRPSAPNQPAENTGRITDTAPSTADTLPSREATAPADLPSSGYFDLQALFSGTRYAAYNYISRAQILSKAQTTFRNAGFYSGEIETASGLNTQAAIIAWQQSLNLPCTGRLDTATLASLALGRITEITPQSVSGMPVSAQPATRSLTPQTGNARSVTLQPAAARTPATKSQSVTLQPVAARSPASKPADKPRYIAITPDKAGPAAAGQSVMIYDTQTGQIVGNNVQKVNPPPKKAKPQ